MVKKIFIDCLDNTELTISVTSLKNIRIDIDDIDSGQGTNINLDLETAVSFWGELGILVNKLIETKDEKNG